MAADRLVVLCGGPDVAVAGARLRLTAPARKQAALALSFLLLEGDRPVPADQLADAVWAKGPPASWQGSLRRIVSDVRAWLDGGGVHAEVRAAHGTYQLVLPPNTSTDVAQGRAALRIARQPSDDANADADAANVAVDHLCSRVLPGYEAPWLSVQRRDVERDYLEALDLLADAERRRGNADAAVAAADQAIAVDPIRESAYRQAMAAHRQAGRVGAALRAYENCRRVLASELGTAPSPATITAYHALLDLPLERAAAAPAIKPGEPLAAAAAAMQRLEDRQTIAALEARLATIDSSPAPDPLRRVTTLIELGRAHWVVEGSTEALRRISLAAGEAALSLRETDAFGDALALASTTTGIGQADPDAVDLCRRGREVFASDQRTQVRILRLEAELVFGVESIEVAQRAVDEARKLGDERLLLDVLLVLDQSLAWVPDIERRLAVERECEELAARVPPTFRRRPTFEVMTRLQIADRTWFDEMRVAYPKGAERAMAWEERVFVSAMHGVEAQVLGDIELANRVAMEMLVDSAGELNTTHAAGGLLLAISRDAGGVAGLVPAVESISASSPRIPAFRAAVAAARAIAGDDDGARAIVDEFARNGFDNVPHEHVYLLYLGLLAEAVALIRDDTYVEALLELLAPYEGQMCVGAHGVVVLSAMDTYRGMLATVTRDPRGEAWFNAGIAVEERLGARLLPVRSRAWKAYLLRDAELFARARQDATDAPGLLEMIDLLESRA